MRKKFPTKKGIIFVDDDSNVIVERPASIQRPHKWRDIIIGVLVSITLCIMGLGGWRLYNYYYNIGVPVSVTPEENIQKLAARHKGGKPAITLTSDSILGVALNMYRLENLQAEISLVEPDTTDMSVWMYSRSADHTSTNEYLGSLVMNGKELASDVSRLEYCAMANGNIGGKCHSFYRTPDGKPHNIGDDTQHPHKKYQEIVPWIIFKAR